MPAVDPVILQLRADVASYRNELKSTTILVDKSLARQEASARRLELTMERSFGAIGGTLGRFTNLLTSIGGIGAAKALLDIADKAKQIDAQLALATATFGTFNQAQDDTRRIAAETRSSLEATSALYSRFTISARETGRTQDEAARATETFTKALKIGGAGTQEAYSATLQFNQALQSGVLRGEEFNAVNEASGRVSRLLAESLGVPIGQLRALAEDGKITSDVLYKALTDRRFTAGIDDEFKRLPVTFSEAMTRVTNAALITFGAFDRGGEFSAALANFISDGTDGFESLERSAEETGIEMRATFAALGDIFDPILAGAQSAFGGVRQEVNYTRDSIANILRLIDNADNFLIGLQNRATGFDNAIKRGLNTAIDRAGGGQKFGIDALTPYADRAGRFINSYDGSQALGRARAQERRISGALPGYMNFNSPDALQSYMSGDYKRARPKSVAATKSAKKTRARTGKATDEAAEAAKLIDSIRADMGQLNADLGRIILNESERLEEASRAFAQVFGNQPDAIGGIVDEYERVTRDEVEQRTADERRLQDIRADNVRSLAGLYEDLFQGGTDAVWRNFKDQGLRALAVILAQATITSFSKGGGGIGSLLGNIASGAESYFGRASGGYVAPGQVVRVNEQRPGAELLRMGPQGGTVIPLGQADQMARRPQSPVVIQVQVEEGQLFRPVVRQISAATAEPIAERTAARAGETTYRQAMKDAPGVVAQARRFGQG